MIRLLLVISCLLVTACASTGSVTSATPPPTYELTLPGVIDGAPFTGVAMASESKNHSITIASKYDVNYFIAKSCHRSEKHEDVIDQGWISGTKSWTWIYSESPTIEDTGDCPMRVCVYSKTVGAPPVQCAVIDNRNSRYTLQIENICNGLDVPNQGKSICHTQVGLMERIRFTEPVFVAPPQLPPAGATDQTPYAILNQCQGKFIDTRQMLFQYIMPSTECYLIFDTVAAPHKRAKITVIPYDLPQYTGG